MQFSFPEFLDISATLTSFSISSSSSILQKHNNNLSAKTYKTNLQKRRKVSDGFI